MQHLTIKEHEQLASLAKTAGTVLLSFWQSNNPSGSQLEITKKPDGSNVTNADLASNEIIIEGLTKLFPHDKILSEEIAPDTYIDDSERVWVVDPLDGTQAFIEGRDDFSVLIALTVKQIAIFGICYFPVRKQLCITGPDLATYQNDRPINCSTAVSPGQERIYVRGCPIKDPSRKYPFQIDSCLAFTMIARGELDGAVIRLNRLKQWDLAAPAALISGAGGKISDDKGAEIKFSAHSFSPRYFIASNGRCHEELINQIVE